MLSLKPDDVQFIGRDLVRPECVLTTRSGDLFTSDGRGGVSVVRPDGTQELILPDDALDGFLPNGIALIMEAYPLHRRSQAMGWWSMAMTGAPVIGLIIGGPLIEAFGWRVVFIVLTPISMVGI